MCKQSFNRASTELMRLNRIKQQTICVLVLKYFYFFNYLKASHRRQAWVTARVDPQSQEGFELACKGWYLNFLFAAEILGNYLLCLLL